MYTLLKYTGPTLITDNIVLGGGMILKNSDLLFDFGISHVLNVAQQLPNMFTCHFNMKSWIFWITRNVTLEVQCLERLNSYGILKISMVVF